MFYIAAHLVRGNHAHHASLGMRKIEMDIGHIAEGWFSIFAEHHILVGTDNTRIATRKAQQQAHA